MPGPVKAFIIDGGTSSVLRDVARVVDVATSIDAVVVVDGLERGRDVIERYATLADPGCVVIALLTADDVGRPVSQPADVLAPRPSQSVMFELGYFLGRLPPGHVIVLREDGLVVPNDVARVATHSLDDPDWRLKLARELVALGATVDSAKIT